VDLCAWTEGIGELSASALAGTAGCADGNDGEAKLVADLPAAVFAGAAEPVAAPLAELAATSADPALFPAAPIPESCPSPAASALVLADAPPLCIAPPTAEAGNNGVTSNAPLSCVDTDEIACAAAVVGIAPESAATNESRSGRKGPPLGGPLGTTGAALSARAFSRATGCGGASPEAGGCASDSPFANMAKGKTLRI
jgi:hypothetical protein